MSSFTAGKRPIWFANQMGYLRTCDLEEAISTADDSPPGLLCLAGWSTRRRPRRPSKRCAAQSRSPLLTGPDESATDTTQAPTALLIAGSCIRLDPAQNLADRVHVPPRVWGMLLSLDISCPTNWLRT